MNASELARLHGVTRETIRQWTVAGCPRRPDGSYIVPETITWRIQRDLTKEREDRAAKSDEPKLTEMNRKLRAEAELKELQLAEMRGTLVDAEEHQAIVSRIAGGFAAVASGQLARFEKRIVQARSPADARLLTQDLHRALMEGAQGLADELEDEADAEHEDAA